jgi:adenylosuccinate synthase
MSDSSEQPRSTAVVGLQFGDEGKGQIVDCLAAHHDVVVRYNGGANAGHSVNVGNEQFALHQVPIGALTAGRLNVLANGVVLDADGLLAELVTLANAGVQVEDRLKISDRAHLVMPYHFAEERLRDLIAQSALGDSQRLGTTSRGIGTCYADKAARDTAVRVADLYEPEPLRARLGFIARIKDAMLAALAQVAGVPHTPVTAAELAKLCAVWADQLRPYVCDTTALLRRAADEGSRVLFEGANAALLDVDHGTYPFVTSSNSSVLGIGAGTGMPPSCLDTVVGVAKVYMSRVGTGPFPTEIHGELAQQLRARGHEFGSTTGRPRRLGWLDLPALRAAASRNGVTELTLTGLSVLAGLPRIRVCTAYRLGNALLEHLPASASVLESVEPVYEEIDGFEGALTACRSLDDLPTPARRLIALIELSVAPVRAVCIGKRRDQLLRIGRAAA